MPPYIVYWLTYAWPSNYPQELIYEDYHPEHLGFIAANLFAAGPETNHSGTQHPEREAQYSR
ncbi:hypothetical protein D3C78_1817600 [compost metagenome]